MDRQLVPRECLCFPERRRMFNHGDKPNLGDKDKAYVTIQPEDIH